MKRLFLLLAAAMGITASWADNQTTTVEQVTTAMELTDDVDLHITSTTPFADEGSVNIVNQEHAVIIFDNLKPSQAARHLSHVTINGAAARNGTNCQFRIYNRGAILYPYGKEGTGRTAFHPLAVYSEQNCLGDTCELFGLENSGGYMNTLTAAKLNKRIRSFRLKRGYMVTFSIRSGGYGYSRCFIADQADLVFNTLPAILDKRIASYRIFRWNNTSKSGLANNTDATACSKLNVTSCYSFSNGEDRGPDVECVPHHIYEGWPSIESTGSVTYSPHMKTNNEPGNSADDHPQSVQEILNNWENLMRTGMRLCSPSSHDGSLNHLRACLDSIDARGWRCDIIDLHCYWPESSFNTWSFYDQWANRYGRPIWISEWVWGASWNRNGAFAGNVTEAQNRDAVRRITTNLNAWDCIERYYYWNSEADPSRIYKNGNLTVTGEYYASMNTGLGYCNYKNYVPKAPPMYKPTELTVTFTKRTGAIVLKWKNSNNGLTDLAIVQRKVGTQWENLDTLVSESATPTLTLRVAEEDYRGLQTFRITDVDYDGKSRSSNEASFFNGEAQTIGDFMVGDVQLDNANAVTIYFQDQEQAPAVFMGMTSNRNTANGIANHIRSITKNTFNYNLDPWTLGKSMTISSIESADYLITQPGQYTWGDMRAEVDTCSFINSKGAKESRVGADTCEITFSQPFPEGVTPVVIVQNVSTQTNLPTVPKVFDVTNTGFRVKLVAQNAATTAIREQLCYYLAITPGSASLGDTGYLIHAGLSDTPVGGAATISYYFLSTAGDTLALRAPVIVAAPQTHRLDHASVFRRASDITKKQTAVDGEEETVIVGMRVRRQTDPSATIPTVENTAARSGDYIGWVAIDIDPKFTGIHAPTVPSPLLPGTVTRVFTLDGRPVNTGTASLRPGLYIITRGGQSQKIMVR